MTGADDGLTVRLDRSLPTELAVGRGTCLFVSGCCADPRRAVTGLLLRADGEGTSLSADAVVRPTAPLTGGDRRARVDRATGRCWSAFWGFLSFEAIDAPRRVSVEAVARLRDGAQVRQRLGELELRPRHPGIEADAEAETREGPLVAICMATHEPPPALVERQIESLRRQTHRRWICLISDDCSSPERFEKLRSLVAGDRRFFLSRSPRRLGFYRNFERALTMVPAGADYVALCDQDDRWYPEKISTLISHLGSAALAYSDMRVIDQDGRALSETFWTKRRNSYTRLGSLLLENTVTGAASIFRRGLLDQALPLPPPLEDSVHDQWIASVGLVTGGIAYVDRPLYDYVQHRSSVTSEHHGDARLGRDGRPRALRAIAPLVRPDEWRRPYFAHVSRIGLSARILELRFGPDLAPNDRRVVRRLARLGNPPEPTGWLALRLLRPLVGRRETGWMERRLLHSIAWRGLGSGLARARGRRCYSD